MASALFNVGRKAFAFFYYSKLEANADATNRKPKCNVRLCKMIINKTRKYWGYMKIAILSHIKKK